MLGFTQLRFKCVADLEGQPGDGHSQISFIGYLAGDILSYGGADRGSSPLKRYAYIF